MKIILKFLALVILLTLSTNTFADQYHYHGKYLDYIIDVPKTWSAHRVDYGYRFVLKSDESRSINVQTNLNAKGMTPQQYAFMLKDDMTNNPEPVQKIVPVQIQKLKGGGPDDVVFTALVNDLETKFIISTVGNSFLIITVTNTFTDEVLDIIDSIQTKNN